MRYRIAQLEIDTQTREILTAGSSKHVEPQVFDLLLLLIENRSRVVGKEELVETIWEGRAISDATLSCCIKSARRALGDDGDRQSMIRTIHRRGFRFVGPVETMEFEDTVPATIASSPGLSVQEPPAACRCQPQQVACACAEHVDAGTLQLPDRPSLAVLPFELQGEEGGRLLSEGLHRDMTAQFARTRWLFVSARASVVALASRGLDAKEIGVRLGVRYLLDGALCVTDGRLRLTLTLTDAQRCCEVWAERFERKMDDIFAVQDEIVELVTRTVEAEIENQERRRAQLCPAGSLDAWSAYHRALPHLYRFREEGYALAEDYLQHAARLDPSAPRVFAALSFLHWQRAFFGIGYDRDRESAMAFDYAHQSIALDPLEPQSHFALGRAHYLAGDIDTGIAELSRAVELCPSFAQGQYSLGYGLMFSSDKADGLNAVERAERLSPYDPMRFAFSALRAILLGLSGEAESAADWADRALREPNAHCHVAAIAAWCNELAGRRARAADHVAVLQTDHPTYTRADYFRAFPFRTRDRRLVEGALERLGL